MSTTAITPVTLAQATRSGDLVGIGTVATTPTDGWVIAATARGADEMIIVCEASDLRIVRLSTSRFLQNDGTILATCVDAGTTIYCILLSPRGH